MAAENGSTPDHLSYLRAIAADIGRYGFFPVVRGAEARARGLPRVGQSRTPGQNVIDLVHAATLEFPAATFEGVEFTAQGRARARSYFLGLTGPTGALPLHLTEYAAYERRYAKSRPFGDFLDVLTGRMLQFFFRAWGDSQPAVQAERPHDDRFATYVGAISGATAGVAPDAVFSAGWRLHYASVFAGRRSAAAIQDALSHLLGSRAQVREYISRWRQVPHSDRTTLGRSGQFNGLGAGAMLGSRARMVDDTFRLEVQTQSIEEYRGFMPGGARFALAAEALTAFAPSHLEWELEPHLNERQAPPAALDGICQLGRSSWLQPLGRDIIRRDARLGAASGST